MADGGGVASWLTSPEGKKKKKEAEPLSFLSQ